MIWQSSGKILSDNWLLGIGPGNFQDKYLEYQKYFPPYLEWAVPHPHNLYLAFWLYGGLVGLVSFLVILYFFFKKVETPKLGVSTGVKYIALGVMIYVLLHGLVDTTIFKNDLAVVFWLTYFSIK
jgi:O-antigen ligase